MSTNQLEQPAKAQADIKQKEIMEEVGLTSPEIKAWRDANLIEGTDFEKRGVSYYWTNEAYLHYIQNEHPQLLEGCRFGEAKEIEEPEAAPEPEPEPIEEVKEETQSPVEVKVLKAARNGKFIYGGLNGVKIPIRVQPKHQKRYIGKTIKVIPFNEFYYIIAP